MENRGLSYNQLVNISTEKIFLLGIKIGKVERLINLNSDVKSCEWNVKKRWKEKNKKNAI